MDNLFSDLIQNELQPHSRSASAQPKQSLAAMQSKTSPTPAKDTKWDFDGMIDANEPKKDIFDVDFLCKISETPEDKRRYTNQTKPAPKAEIKPEIPLKRPENAQKPTPNAVETLVAMGFSRSAAESALQENSNNVELAIDALFAKKSSKPAAAAKRNSESFESAKSFGLGLFQNAKSVFESTKKRVESVINERSQKNYKEPIPENWNNPTFRDTLGYGSDESPVGIRESSESIEVALQRSQIPMKPEELKPKEETGNLLMLSNDDLLLDINNKPAEKTNVFWDAVAKPMPVELKPQPKVKSEPPFDQSIFSTAKSNPKPQNPIVKPATVSKWREQGNEFFKRGDYAAAIQVYTAGINSNPDQSEILVLLNNRAQCSLKTGDFSSAISDTTDILTHQSNTKALLRRAQAHEGLEHYELALNDYRLVLEDGADKTALDGLNRCQSMLNQSSQPKRVVNKPTNSQVKAAMNTAVQQLRKQEAQKQQVENTKFAANDKVQDKIAVWKKGKENNLRALLSSLHDVLWPSLSWKKVTLADLISNKQVKMQYMKVVAKIHPDKLREASVEEQLIAENVFAVINKAWDTFRDENKL